jgi:hypothetical protein
MAVQELVIKSSGNIASDDCPKISETTTQRVYDFCCPECAADALAQGNIRY